MYEIIPGVLEKDWESIEKKIDLVLPFAKSLHVDILDGKFAPNTTFLDPKPFAKYKDKILLEVHMMVDEPINYLKPFAQAGFKRFVGHVEKMSDQVEFVAKGELLGEVGLAIDGKTSLDAVKVSYDDLDMLLFMTINAGFSGQAFAPEHLDKVRKVRESSNIKIEVDGGINDQTILLARNAGVNLFSATSFIYKENSQRQFQILENLVK